MNHTVRQLTLCHFLFLPFQPGAAMFSHCQPFQLFVLQYIALEWWKIALAPTSGKKKIKLTRKKCSQKTNFWLKATKLFQSEVSTNVVLCWCKQLVDFSWFLCSRIFPFCLSRISIFFSSSILFSLSVLKKARFSKQKLWFLHSKSWFRSETCYMASQPIKTRLRKHKLRITAGRMFR